ncbi:hypothetical protein [Dickeya zeae]|uniref:hypothetical protein n=1 Tax=Dickeya zeae TaxID=204042 RepID=UPI001F2CBF31|nr:hypothetical protein [Dickeya zeae]UJR63001.1 hypothetical protein HJ586_12760 [Dickeya zeae]
MSEITKGKFNVIKDKLSSFRKKPQAENTDAVFPDNGNISGDESAHAGFAKYKPLLESMVINGLLTIAEDKLSDDVFVESVFSKTWELLPAPVRMVVKREWCLHYLHSRKAPLLAQLQIYRAGKVPSVETLALSDKGQTEKPSPTIP